MAPACAGAIDGQLRRYPFQRYRPTTNPCPSIRLEQKGHDETRPCDLGSEDADKQPLAEQQSKYAARRREEDEQHQLSFSPTHHRASPQPMTVYVRRCNTHGNN